jgi:hypothetical protein
MLEGDARTGVHGGVPGEKKPNWFLIVMIMALLLAGGAAAVLFLK